MFCKNCGAQLPDGAVFCTSCGTQTSQQSQQPTYQPQQPTYQPQQPTYAYQQPAYAQPVGTTEKPMGWFKFMIYFALFAGALLNLVTAIQMLTGAQYGDSKDLVYGFFPSLKTIDVIMGIVLLGLVAFIILVRFRLAGFKKDGPKLLAVMYAAVLAFNILYIILVASVLSDFGAGIGDLLTPSVVVSLLGSAVMLIVNKIYFDKRKELFIN